ncbi:MAG: GNAT family N-acetyltransferase [Firmicutes bacterium]|nr:GNAT family N-acetyltransferase [Bacillota bacterium]
MFELHKNEYYRINEVFQDISHSHPIVYSVLEGNQPGKVFIDDIKNPRTALLYPTNSFFYIAGDEKNNEFLQEIKKLIFEDLLVNNEDELVLFAFSKKWRDKLDELLGDKESVKIERRDFDFIKTKFKEKRLDLDKGLPKGYKLIKINKEVANQIGIIKSWGNIEGFMNKGIGYCIVKGDKVVSSCYSIYIGNKMAEINIHTNENHREKGLATAVVISFIEECLSRGIKPNWSCWPFKEASLKLAKKLGFVEKKDVVAHYWSRNI